MDKTYIIILLLVVIIIAIFYKKDKNQHPQNMDQYYRNISHGTNQVMNDISGEANQFVNNVSSGAKDTFNQIQENQYYKDINKGINNIWSNIENNFNNKAQNKESFNNHLSRKLLHQKINVSNLPRGKGDFPNKLISTNPILIQIKAFQGEQFISVTDINGINPGDMILINPRGKNSEINYVAGIGNNILHLNKPLKHNHRPNEEINNRYNSNLNPSTSRFPNIGYAEIDKNREVQFTPNGNTWDFNVNINDQVVKGWCGPDSQLIQNSKFPNCLKECKMNKNCNAIRWIKDTNDCSLMKSCEKTNNDNRWRHMPLKTPSFSIGEPQCGSGRKPLNKSKCQQIASAQNMPFYNWSENNEWPEGCFQYQVGGKPSLAHNPSKSSSWPSSGYNAIQYCK